MLICAGGEPSARTAVEHALGHCLERNAVVTKRKLLADLPERLAHVDADGRDSITRWKWNGEKPAAFALSSGCRLPSRFGMT